MAGLTNTFSADKRFFRNANYPPNCWTCITCHALVMVGERPAHKKDCDAQHAGFGS